MLTSHRASQACSALLSLTLLVFAACAPPPPAAAPTSAPAAPPAAKPTTAPAAQAPAAAQATAAPTQAQAAQQPAGPAPTQAPAAQGAAKPGGNLRIAGEVQFDDLDPHTQRVGWQIAAMQNVYSTLIRVGPDLLPQPDLATEWKYTDPQTLAFTLRQGAKFHNGREVVASDVKYSLERILDPKTGSSYASNLASIESIDTPDDYHVVIHTKRPDAALLNNLSMAAMGIVPKEAVDANGGNLKTTMVGSGPFMFKENIPDQRLVLVKNPNYFIPGQPLLDSLTFVPLPNETARTNALRSGEVDYIEPAPPKDVRAFRNDPSLTVTGGPNLSFVAISVNTARKPFDDVRVRQALAWSIDRDAVGAKAFDGFAQPLFGPPLIPPFWAGNTDKYYSKNVDKAKELLAEAGLPNGFKATLMTDTTSYHAGLATVAQAEWKNVGIDVEIQNIDSATAVDRWVKKDFDMYPIRWWGSDFIDPDGAFRPLFSCNASYNVVSYCNKEVDDLLDQGVSVTDVAQRKAIYADAMKMLAEEQPWVFLVSFDRFQAMKSYVKGYTAFPNASQYSFREVWLDK